MLRIGLIQFLDRCLQSDFFPTVHLTDKRYGECVLIINTSNNRVSWLGVMQTVEGDDILVSFMINLPKWCWAETEGFTIDNILDNNTLCDAVFQLTDPEELHEKLN